MGSGMNDMLAMQVCSVTNPFCPEAVGARWPDNSYTRSLTYSTMGYTKALTANAAGLGAVLYFGDGKYNINEAATYVAGTATFSNATSFTGTWPTGVVRFRLTSFGVRVSSAYSPNTVSGMLRIRLYSPVAGASLTVTDPTSVLCDDQWDIPIARLTTKDVFVTSAPLGDMARQFKTEPASTAISSWTNPGWQVIGVAVDGAPASAVGIINIQAYYHYEIVVGEADTQSSLATAPPPNNPVVREASAGVLARVGNFASGAASAVNRVFESSAGQFVAQGLLTYFTKKPPPMLMNRAAAMLVD